jgi:hypothetical protein
MSGHDPSNTHLRGLLAERTYQRGLESSRHGRRDEALVTVDEGLALDPDHRAAGELPARLRPVGERAFPRREDVSHAHTSQVDSPM